MLLGKSGEIAGSKWKWCLTVDVSGGEHTVQCCKELYCTGAWNVRSKNQGSKLDEVKQEMSRVNIDILEINELKLMRMGKFNSDDHYIYYYGQEPLQFSSVAQSCPTLCDPMNRSTPGLPVHQQLLEFTQTHVHWVRDAIHPSHPLSSPSPPAPNPSQRQGLFQWVALQ